MRRSKNSLCHRGTRTLSTRQHLTHTTIRAIAADRQACETGFRAPRAQHTRISRMHMKHMLGPSRMAIVSRSVIITHMRRGTSLYNWRNHRTRRSHGLMHLPIYLDHFISTRVNRRKKTTNNRSFIRSRPLPQLS